MSRRNMDLGKVLDASTYTVSFAGIAAILSHSVEWADEHQGGAMVLIALATFISSQLWRLREDRRHALEHRERVKKLLEDKEQGDG